MMKFILCIVLLTHFFWLLRGDEDFILNQPKFAIKFTERDLSGWYSEELEEETPRGSRAVGVNISESEKRIIVPKEIIKLRITCSADYPIYWDYDVPEEISHHDYNIEVQSYRESSGLNLTDPSSYKYYSYLNINGDGRGVTGNYSCISARDENTRINYYIFWTNALRQLIYGHEIHKSKQRVGSPQSCSGYDCPGKPSKTVMADPDNATITLPCTVVSPNVSLQLFKKNNSSSSHTLLKDIKGALGIDYDKDHENYSEIKLTNDSITFDPERGFVLKVKELPHPYGIYKCLLKTSHSSFKNDEVLVINVTKGTQRRLDKHILVGSAKQYYYNGRIICCSNGTQPPKIYKRSCSPRVHCARIRRLFQNFEVHYDKGGGSSKNCQSTSSLWSANSGVFRCVGEGIDITREYFIPAKRVGEEVNAISNGNGTMLSDIYYDSEISHMPRDHVISITNSHEISQNEVYSNIYVDFTCHSPTDSFDLGTRWSIVWKNGSTNVLPTGLPYKSSYYEESIPENINSIRIDMTEDIAGVICHAPLHNSTQWISKTILLKTRHATKPTIEGPAMEEITWKEGDKNKNLICKFDSDPRSIANWIIVSGSGESNRNIALRTSGFNVDYSKRSATISFTHVHILFRGNYTCIVKNAVGTTTKLFQLNVLSSDAKLPESTTEHSDPVIFPTIKTATTSKSTERTQNKIVTMTSTAPAPMIHEMALEHKTDEKKSNSSTTTWIVVITLMAMLTVIAILGIAFLRYSRLKRLQPGSASKSFRQSIMALSLIQQEATEQEDL